jgi:hypothetical protein
VEPGLAKDALHVSCGRCQGNVEGPGYLAVGNDTLADQVKDLLLPRREPGLPGAGIQRQPIREHFDHRVRAPLHGQRGIHTRMPWWYVPLCIGFDVVVGVYLLVAF